MSPLPVTPHPDVPVDFQHPAQPDRITILDAEQAIIDVSPRKRKVALIGFAQSSRQLAPYTDPAYEIWGLNQLYRFIPRATRWFDIHENWHEHVVEGTDHAGWIRNAPIPVYMKERERLFPSSVRYPIERVLGLLSTFLTEERRQELAASGQTLTLDYFTSSVAFMLALAIAEGFETIDLYGIDLITKEEYRAQKPCVEFWIGVAAGRGIEVGIPVQSALLKQSHRYGYEREPQSLIQLSELDKRVAELKGRRHKLQMELAGVDGALQEMHYWSGLAELRANGAQYNAE